MSNRARYLGTGVIAGLWVLAGYLVLYYAVLLYFGADRLHAMLGTRIYNAVLPLGGFYLLASVALTLGVWTVPLGTSFVTAYFALRLTDPRGSPYRRKTLSALAALAITAVLHFGTLDGWPWMMVPDLGGDDTQFAPEYSALGFWSIREGMTAEEVVARAGQPLERYPIRGHPDEEGWRWTRSPHSSNYRVRALLFRGGRIVERVSYFYLD